MGYSRKTFKKRSFGKRFKKRPNVNQLNFRNIGNMSLKQAAYGAMRGVNIMKGIINSEKKRFDKTISQTITNTPVVLDVSIMAQGDDVNGRNGNSILAKYITFNYDLAMNVAVNSSFVRILGFVDTEYNGTVATSTDLFVGANLTSPINPDSTQRFTVLFDKKHSLSVQGLPITSRKIYIPLNFHIKYTGTTNATTSGSKNNIFIMMVSDAATNSPTLIGDVRTVYYDN